jgi:hypothetical protein
MRLRDFSNPNNNFASKYVYVIEEVDKSLDEDGIVNPNYSYETILQFLDGNIRSQDSLVVMTTNNLELLEKSPVLMRQGRHRIKLEFNNIEKVHCDHLVKLYYNIDDSAELWNVIGTMKICELDHILQNAIISELSYESLVRSLQKN